MRLVHQIVSKGLICTSNPASTKEKGKGGGGRGGGVNAGDVNVCFVQCVIPQA